MFTYRERKARVHLAVSGIVLGAVLASTSALPAEPLGSNIRDVEFLDGFACWQTLGSRGGFNISAVDPMTGLLDPPSTTVPIRPESLSVTQNGPEIFATDAGVACVGTRDNGGIVRFDFAGSNAVIDGTEDLFGPMPPIRLPGYLLPCPERFLARDASASHTYMVDGGGHVTSLPTAGSPFRWLSCKEVVVKSTPGIRVFDVEAGIEMASITDTDYQIANSFPATASSRQRYFVGAKGKRLDLHHSQDKVSAWHLISSESSPVPTYPNFYSVELFEWQGKMWVSGIVTKGKNSAASHVFLYDTDVGLWYLFGNAAVNNKDPETLPLANDRLAVYWVDSSLATTVVEIFKHPAP